VTGIANHLCVSADAPRQAGALAVATQRMFDWLDEWL